MLLQCGGTLFSWHHENDAEGVVTVAKLCNISYIAAGFGLFGTIFRKKCMQHVVFRGFLLTLHRGIDRSNAGERLRTGLTANEHAPAVQRY